MGAPSAHVIPPPDARVVERALRPWLHDRKVERVDLLPGGLMNRNCRVRVSGSAAPVVLRMYDRDPAAAAKEIAILRLLRGRVPVPDVLYAEPAASDHLPPFTVLEFVDGVALVQLKWAGEVEAMSAAAYDAGRLLARLQVHRFAAPGLLTGTLAVASGGLPNPLTTASLVEHFTAAPAFRRRVAASTRDEVFRAAREWDEDPDAPLLGATLAHGDFNARNVLVDRHTRSVAAILDWEFAFAGSLYCDIGNFLRYERPDRPRFEPFFSNGLRDGGVTLEGDWRRAARMADLPALCELLTREALPDDIAAEVIELMRVTCRGARS